MREKTKGRTKTQEPGGEPGEPGEPGEEDEQDQLSVEASLYISSKEVGSRFTPEKKRKETIKRGIVTRERKRQSRLANHGLSCPFAGPALSDRWESQLSELQAAIYWCGVQHGEGCL